MRPKPAKEEPQTAKEPVQPVKETPSPAPKPPQEGKGGRVLTEKKSYNLDELIAGMQEMEDMMEEMRGTIEEFKKRRR